MYSISNSAITTNQLNAKRVGNPAKKTPVTVFAGSWGSWKGAKYCPDNHYVCGANLRFEDWKSGKDDTGANGLILYCCPFSS